MYEDISTLRSLSNMIIEMYRNNLDLKRITKTASLLILSGTTKNSIPKYIVKKVEKEQQLDGGWVSIVDTVWNTFFLKIIDDNKYKNLINKGLEYIKKQKNEKGLWGRSNRDKSRIPVTGIIFFLFPEIVSLEDLIKLEKLWEEEKNSLVYKAGYVLMAFKRNKYTPEEKNLIKNTCKWLENSQRNNGGFAPWYEHPKDSDIFCTSIAILGLLQYPKLVNKKVYKKAKKWIYENRLENGLWKFHELEDGASWGLYTIKRLKRFLNAETQ